MSDTRRQLEDAMAHLDAAMKTLRLLYRGIEEPSTSIEERLLDLIGRAESRGNYNAYYGAASNQSNPDFARKTLKQVETWQRKFVASGSPSSAVGKYQFIRKTLSGLAEKMNMNPETTYLTPHVQDMMAIRLLRRRGLDRFKAGDIDAIKFGNRLAKEWASLPVMSGRKAGRSYYAGDGLNKAHVSIEEMKQVLS